MTTPPTPEGQTAAADKTEVGSYFISNYPPFSFWSADHNAEAEAAIRRPPAPDAPLGLYLHIPFCRKRCKFCYFRVYTDKNSRQVEDYLDALTREVALYSREPVLEARPFRFAYFGGGTPSFLSEKQLLSLVDRLRASIDWDDAEEVTFECEPGTLKEAKLKAIKEMGVTRLSLGVENFDDKILEENGRAHRSPEVFHAYEWARDCGFDQINIDLIAGMIGETDANWRDCVKKTIDLAPESVTIYQLELPFNAVYSGEIQGGTQVPVATWQMKRDWVDYAFRELAAAGYETSSAYTMVKRSDAPRRFVYRDALWHGADMLGTGVASFSHVSGVHYQNVDGDQRYIEAVNEGRLPIGRSLVVTDRQRMIRELILQLKLGRIDPGYFSGKFGVDVLAEFAGVWRDLETEGYVESASAAAVTLTRAGLLRVDSLLPRFFEPEHQNARYT